MQSEKTGMQCILCGADIPPLTGTSYTRIIAVDGVRIIAVDGVGFAACAPHFPSDGASEAEYTAAYDRFIRAAVQAMEDVVPGASLFNVAPDSGPGHGGS